MYVWEPLIVLYKYIFFFMFWTKVDENQIEYWLLFYKLLKFTFQDCLKQERILTTFICMLWEPISSTIPFHIPHKPDALNIYLHSYSEYLPCFILLTYYFSQESYGPSPSRCFQPNGQFQLEKVKASKLIKFYRCHRCSWIARHNKQFCNCKKSNSMGISFQKKKNKTKTYRNNTVFSTCTHASAVEKTSVRAYILLGKKNCNWILDWWLDLQKEVLDISVLNLS